MEIRHDPWLSRRGLKGSIKSLPVRGNRTRANVALRCPLPLLLHPALPERSESTANIFFFNSSPNVYHARKERRREKSWNDSWKTESKKKNRHSCVRLATGISTIPNARYNALEVIKNQGHEYASVATISCCLSLNDNRPHGYRLFYHLGIHSEFNRRPPRGRTGLFRSHVTVPSYDYPLVRVVGPVRSWALLGSQVVYVL